MSAELQKEIAEKIKIQSQGYDVEYHAGYLLKKLEEIQELLNQNNYYHQVMNYSSRMAACIHEATSHLIAVAGEFSKIHSISNQMEELIEKQIKKSKEAPSPIKPSIEESPF